MKNQNELNYKDLKMTSNPNIFEFDTTNELESRNCTTFRSGCIFLLALLRMYEEISPIRKIQLPD